MAIKQTISVSGAVSIESGGVVMQTGETATSEISLYVKLVEFSGSKEFITAKFHIFNVKSGAIVKEKLVSFEPDLQSADNFIAQAYSHIKTMPEFEGAVDC